jgi:glyoxylase-like metal-dependent hydrolase (beta-lactamase superfamily II)
MFAVHAFYRPLTLLVLSLTVAVLCGASNLSASRRTSVALDSQAKARAILEQAVRALGGVDALRAIRIVRRDFKGGWAGFGQSRRPWTGDRDPPLHEADVAVDIIDYTEGRSYESLKYSQHGRDWEFATDTDVIVGGKGFHISRYIDEKPALRDLTAEDVRAMLVARHRRHPEGALLMALERVETLAWVGEEEGRNVVSFADATGTRILLHVDKRTHLPVKSQVLRAHALVGDTSAETIYSDYRAVAGVRLPHRYIERLGGARTQDWSVVGLQVNPQIAATQFERPKAYSISPATPSEPMVEKIGHGLFLIRGPYTVMFAVFRDEVVMVEAPLNAAYASACLKLVRETAPGKAIRLVATHFHYDHIGGIRTFIAEGIPILTTADAKVTIERLMSAKHTMRPDALTRSPRPAVIDVVRGKRVFDDGALRLEVHDLGPTDHVEQILAAYVPNEKLLYQADLWDPQSNEYYFAGADGSVLARRVRELKLDVERIVSTHGVPATMTMLQDALAVRAKYAR